MEEYEDEEAAFQRALDHDYPEGCTAEQRNVFRRGWKHGLAWIFSEMTQAADVNEMLGIHVGISDD